VSESASMALGKLQNPNLAYLAASCQEFRKKGVRVSVRFEIRSIRRDEAFDIQRLKASSCYVLRHA
jgi:hypothetical protein